MRLIQKTTIKEDWIRDMTNLTKEEYARLHLKAKRGMLTAEERAALEAYEAAAQPAPQTPVPADTETLLCCPYCGHATITTQIGNVQFFAHFDSRIASR